MNQHEFYRKTFDDVVAENAQLKMFAFDDLYLERNCDNDDDEYDECVAIKQTNAS